MSSPPKKTRSTRKPATRKTAGQRKSAPKGGRRPPAKRTTAGKRRSTKRGKASQRGLLLRAGLGGGALALLLLAVLTLSWPGGKESPPQQVAEESASPPAQDTVAKAKTRPAPETKTVTLESRALAKAAEAAPAPDRKVRETSAPATAVSAPAETSPPASQQAALPPKASPPAWKRYAAAHSAKPGQPMIAIVLDDLGPSPQRTRNAIQLPGPLTLAFLPYAEGLPAVTAEARRRGHELLIHMPMEPKDLAHNNPGKNALLTSLSDEEIRRRLDWALQRFPAYVGINNHMGSAFTADRRRMDLVMQRLAGEGALFLDSVTSGASQGASAARAAGIPTIKRDIFLDHGGDDAGLVLKQLAKVEEVAKRQGYAVAIGHPHDGTVTALELWIPDALARGFVLVPISALVEAPGEAGLRG